MRRPTAIAAATALALGAALAVPGPAGSVPADPIASPSSEVSAAAAGPLVQLGQDDRRMSSMGDAGRGWGVDPDVAAGSATTLVVWAGDDPGGASGLADEEHEIWGQRVDPATGEPVGGRLRISAMGTDGDPSARSERPAVAWSPATDTWLVVWAGTGGPGLVAGEQEIWAREVAADGTLGADTTRMSAMGVDGDLRAAAYTPDVAGGDAGWLVTWSGDDVGPATADDEHEIWSRSVGAGAVPTAPQARLSAMGPDADAAFAAYDPAVAGTADSGWMVTWWGDDQRDGLVDGDYEIFARLVSAAGAVDALPPTRVSAVGPDGSTDTWAVAPSVAAHPDGTLLVAWAADDGAARRIEAVRLGPDLQALGAPVAVATGTSGRAELHDPVVTHVAGPDEWLVAWWGDDTTPPRVDGEWEVSAQRLSPAGALLGGPVPVSDMGAPGDLDAAARHPAVAPSGPGTLVVWAGTDAVTPALVDTEVHAQLLGQAVPSTNRFVPLTPQRVLDTRRPDGGRLGPEGRVDATVTGPGAVPPDAGATAVVLNVTVAEATAAGYVTAWPAGRLRPLASNLNVSGPGQDRANLVVVPIGDGGRVSLSTQSGGHLVADVTGYFVPESYGRSGRLQAVAPARVFDTRDGTGTSPGIRPADSEVVVPVTGRGGVPTTGVSAVVANVTLTEAAAAGFVTAWPDGAVRPLASTLNAAAPGDVVPNLVMLPVGVDGRIRLYTQSGGHLVVDVFGWFSDDSAAESASGLFTPLDPTRVLDTRGGVGALTGRMGADDLLPLRLPGLAGVPDAGVGAVVANLTVASATAPGFLTAWPPNTLRPNVSNVNVTAAGQDVPNLAVVGLSPGGVVSFYSQSGGHLVVDLAGWFAA